ncbi:hypothetical protein [Vibrio metschnikovii]|uniref:hypothetical protein n=1 Tax=Vibrio metschnikovii TaxID=28172 RepID=UPI0027E434F5|nr:hypothetical protein [Vibrio metschnikovii]
MAFSLCVDFGGFSVMRKLGSSVVSPLSGRYTYGGKVETFGTIYAKAIDDLSSKIFIPVFISALFSELSPLLYPKMGFWEIYVPLFVVGIMLASLVLLSISFAEVYVSEFRTYVGMFCMPLGAIGLLPQYFDAIVVPYTQVTGFSLLVWSFVLANPLRFVQQLLDC